MVGRAAEHAVETNVSADFLRVFAIEPAVGRAFTPEETEQGSAATAMISYTYWQAICGDGDACGPCAQRGFIL